MASGSYMPTPVLEVPIPKKDGGERRLGIPTVSDKIAQTVVKNRVEPRLEAIFHKDSYGYRPMRGAHDALGITRKRCWEYNWVIDLDIKGFFDNIDRELLLKAVDHHVSEPWMRFYIRRWLVAPMQTQVCGTLVERTQGTPQGGVISPLLANLFLHYVFDHWMQRHHSESPFARYADDAVIHCRSRSQAQELLQAIKERFEACGLELHPLKTKIVYCKDDARHESHEHEKFTFLSYEFRARKVRTRYGTYFVGFNPAISRESIVRLREEVRSWKLLSQTSLGLEELGKKYNAKIRGWINYYGRF
jgi:RNA-directed DNA polymerase